MNKSTYWTGHILSGSPRLFDAFQTATGAAAPAAQGTSSNTASPAPSPARASTASAAPAPTSPTPAQLKASAIWFCALMVTKAHYAIDSNDPAGSLAEPTDWSNAAGQQAPLMAINMNQEAPAIAAHYAASYNLSWARVVATDLTGCATVEAILELVQGRYG